MLLLFSRPVVSDCLRPQACNTPGLPVHHISYRLPKFMSTALMVSSSHLILWCSLPLLPSIFPSIRDFSSELAVHVRWPEHWSFSISPSNEYSGLISLRIDWFDLLAVEGILKSLLQHYNWKASVLQCSAFFMIQLLHPYITSEKTIDLTIWTFVVSKNQLTSRNVLVMVIKK